MNVIKTAIDGVSCLVLLTSDIFSGQALAYNNFLS